MTNLNCNLDIPRVAIYGSCVSRDLLDPLIGKQVELFRYIARQSLISAAHGNVELALNPQLFSSNFQFRCIDWDFQGNAFKYLQENRASFDYLLLDLVDERNGVISLPGGYITNNWELHHIEIYPTLPTRTLIPFGSTTHQELWAAAADLFLQTLQNLQLLEKTILICPSFASQLDTPALTEITKIEVNRSAIKEAPAEPTPAALAKLTAQANKFNHSFPWYWSYLTTKGITKTVTLPAYAVHTSATHQWGLTSFHYSSDTEVKLRNQLLAYLQ